MFKFLEEYLAKKISSEKVKDLKYQEENNLASQEQEEVDLYEILKNYYIEIANDFSMLKEKIKENNLIDGNWLNFLCKESKTLVNLVKNGFLKYDGDIEKDIKDIKKTMLNDNDSKLKYPEYIEMIDYEKLFMELIECVNKLPENINFNEIKSDLNSLYQEFKKINVFNRKGENLANEEIELKSRELKSTLTNFQTVNKVVAKKFEAYIDKWEIAIKNEDKDELSELEKTYGIVDLNDTFLIEVDKSKYSDNPFEVMEQTLEIINRLSHKLNTSFSINRYYKVPEKDIEKITGFFNKIELANLNEINPESIFPNSDVYDFVVQELCKDDYIVNFLTKQEELSHAEYIELVSKINNMIHSSVQNSCLGIRADVDFEVANLNNMMGLDDNDEKMVLGAYVRDSISKKIAINPEYYNKIMLDNLDASRIQIFIQVLTTLSHEYGHLVDEVGKGVKDFYNKEKSSKKDIIKEVDFDKKISVHDYLMNIEDEDELFFVSMISPTLFKEISSSENRKIKVIELIQEIKKIKYLDDREEVYARHFSNIFSTKVLECLSNEFLLTGERHKANIMKKMSELMPIQTKDILSLEILDDVEYIENLLFDIENDFKDIKNSKLAGLNNLSQPFESMAIRRKESKRLKEKSDNLLLVYYKNLSEENLYNLIINAACDGQARLLNKLIELSKMIESDFSLPMTRIRDEEIIFKFFCNADMGIEYMHSYLKNLIDPGLIVARRIVDDKSLNNMQKLKALKNCFVLENNHKISFYDFKKFYKSLTDNEKLTDLYFELLCLYDTSEELSDKDREFIKSLYNEYDNLLAKREKSNNKSLPEMPLSSDRLLLS